MLEKDSPFSTFLFFEVIKVAVKDIKWDITGKCNLSCIHCSAGDKYTQENSKELSLEEKYEIIDKLAEGGVTSINLLGGEPMILGNEFFSIIRYGVSKGIRMSSNTNGLFLNNEQIKKLADAGISGLTIAIEGPSPESHDAIRGKGTFKKVISNVRNLTEYISKKNVPLEITINTVLNRHNYQNIEKMVDLCLDLVVDKWNLLQLGYIGFAKRNVADLWLSTEEILDVSIRIAKRVDPKINDLKNLIFEPRFTYPLVRDFIIKEYGWEMPLSKNCCTGSLTLGFIDPFGNMFACDRVANDEYNGTKIGSSLIKPMNLLDHTFYEIWNSEYFLDMFPLIFDDATFRNYEPCNHCKYLKTGICTPCPLYSLNTEKIMVEECLFVEKKLGDISNWEEQNKNVSQFQGECKGDIQEYKAIKSLEYKYPVKVSGIRSYNKKKDITTLFNPYTTDFLNLNLMGTKIWDLIDGNQSIYEIFVKLKDKITFLLISENQFEEKIEYFFYVLNKEGLITLSNVRLPP